MQLAVTAIAPGAVAQTHVKYAKFQAGNRTSWGMLENDTTIEVVGATTLRNKVVAAKAAATSSGQ